MKFSLKIIVVKCILIGMPSVAQKISDTKTQKEVCITKADSTDFEIFKKDAEKQIRNNQQKIALLRTKKINANAKASENFNKKIVALEMKNDELQKRISGCNNIKPGLWLSFKTKFARDLKKLGDALDDMAVDQYEISQ